MELEHSITLTGLKKNFSYFADIYSTDSEGETVSTFTIAFQTNDVEDPEQASDSEESGSDGVEEGDTESSDDEDEILNQVQDDGGGEQDDGGGEQDDSGDTSSDTDGDTSDGGSDPEQSNDSEESTSDGVNLPLADSDGDGELDFDFDSEPTVEDPDQPEFIASTGESGSFSINWEEPNSGAPSSGYRVDVFDAHGNLLKQFILDSNTKIQAIEGLPNGAYSVVVYSNNDGVYEKIAFSEFVISEESSGLRTMFLITAPILLVLALLWFLRHRKRIGPVASSM
jgi:hypothetical protein